MDGAGRGGAPRDGGSSLRAPPAAGEQPRSNLAALTLLTLSLAALTLALTLILTLSLSLALTLTLTLTRRVT